MYPQGGGDPRLQGGQPYPPQQQQQQGYYAPVNCPGYAVPQPYQGGGMPTQQQPVPYGYGHPQGMPPPQAQYAQPGMAMPQGYHGVPYGSPTKTDPMAMTGGGGGRAQYAQEAVQPPKEPGASTSGGGSGNDPGTPGFRDVWAAVLFLLHVAVIIYVALTFGLKTMKEGMQPGQTADGEPAHPPSSAFAGVVVVLAAAAIWSQLVLGVLLKHAKNMITITVMINVACAGVTAVASIFMHSMALIIGSLITLAFTLCWYYMIRSRIPFAAANLRASTAAIKSNTSTVLMALFLTLLQVGWLLLWSLAVSGVVVKEDQSYLINGQSYDYKSCSTVEVNSVPECHCLSQLAATGSCDEYLQGGVNGLYTFLFLISLFWGSLVLKYLLFCTVSGAVADWLLNPNPKNAVSQSFKRASTTSFGSICFGALLISVLKALREIASRARRQGQEEGRENALACVAECILGCIERLMEIFNRYTMAYVALYGQGFVQSGRLTLELFKRSGMTAVVNDDLTETVLMLLSLVVGLLTALIGFIYAKMSSLPSDWGTLLAILGFFVGMAVCTVVMSVVDAGVATVYLCFIESPAAITSTHPELGQELLSAWASVGYRP